MKLVSLDRLRVEMEDWKTKSNKMTMDLNKLNAQYREMEAKVTLIRQYLEVHQHFYFLLAESIKGNT